MRILIVKVSALGDIIHSLPVLDYLHKVDPDAQVDWVVEEQSRELLRDHPLIQNLISINTKKWRNHPISPDTFQEVKEVIVNLRRAHYDIALDLQGNIKSGIIAKLSGARLRYGFDRNGVRESLNLLCNSIHVPLLPEDYHVSCRSLRVASAHFGIDPSTMELDTDIATSQDDDRFAQELLAKHTGSPAILFHNGTSWPTKLWHTDAWVELGILVLDRFPSATILLSWGNQEEHDIAEAISRGIGRPAVVVLPLMSLKQLCAILKRADLVVGGDTGPIHLAAAVSTQTVSFYRVTDPLRNGPVGRKHLHVQTGLACRECLRKQCNRDDECRRSISARTVLEKIESLLE